MILVNLAEMPWSNERRRNAAMFLRLLGRPPFSSGIYVDPPTGSSRATNVGGRFRMAKDSFRLVEVEPRVRQYAPHFFLPFYHRPAVFKATVALFRRVLARAIGDEPYCLWINSVESGAHELAMALAERAQRVVVDLSDDWTTFRDEDPAALAERLRAVLARADAVIAVNEHVLAKFPHPRARVFHNATDFENFQRRDPTFALDGILPKTPGRKIVGFVGGLHVERVDQPLLLRMIDAMPDVTFVFVGYWNARDLVAQLEARPNVVVRKGVPHRDLPNVIHAFDVAIIPHLINEHTRGNDLLKVLDYMACGIPVVTTDCSNVRKYGQALHVVDTHDEFIATVRRLIDGGRHDPAPGLAAAQAASWDRTVPELSAWLATTLA
jgi:glycosyltransferase involved in cell wall biosynthesis